ncbi:MAG TPA: hypothetical protein VGB85_25570 [Nannocystis sp.]|jgi:hypothetical protein
MSGTSETSETSGTSAGTTDETTDGTTGAIDFGRCGWYAQGQQYTCSVFGGWPGHEDPAMVYPIACPDGLEKGDDCARWGIDAHGCCLADAYAICEGGGVFVEVCYDR